MARCPVDPDQNGFQFVDGEEVISTSLPGGPPALRADVIGAWGRYTVKWTCDRDDYNAMRSFWKNDTQKGALGFTIMVYMDDGYRLTEHEAKFVPKTFGLASQSGHTFVLQAQIDVNPEPVPAPPAP